MDVERDAEVCVANKSAPLACRLVSLPHLAACFIVAGAGLFYFRHVLLPLSGTVLVSILYVHFSGVQSRYFPISRKEKENLENRTSLVDFFHFFW